MSNGEVDLSGFETCENCGNGEFICGQCQHDGYSFPRSNEVSLKDLVLAECGYRDGAETSAYGSADNDLAQERADAVMNFLELAKEHSLPNKLLPH